MLGRKSSKNATKKIPTKKKTKRTYNKKKVTKKNATKKIPTKKKN